MADYPDIVTSGDGVELAVKASPGAKRDALLGVWNGALRISVSSPPEDGRANEAIARVLAGALGVRRAQVTLVRGATSRLKRFRISLTTAVEVRQRLANALGG